MDIPTQTNPSIETSTTTPFTGPFNSTLPDLDLTEHILAGAFVMLLILGVLLLLIRVGRKLLCVDRAAKHARVRSRSPKWLEMHRARRARRAAGVIRPLTQAEREAERDGVTHEAPRTHQDGEREPGQLRTGWPVRRAQEIGDDDLDEGIDVVNINVERPRRVALYDPPGEVV